MNSVRAHLDEPARMAAFQQTDAPDPGAPAYPNTTSSGLTAVPSPPVADTLAQVQAPEAAPNHAPATAPELDAWLAPEIERLDTLLVEARRRTRRRLPLIGAGWLLAMVTIAEVAPSLGILLFWGVVLFVPAAWLARAPEIGARERAAVGVRDRVLGRFGLRRMQDARGLGRLWRGCEIASHYRGWRLGAHYWGVHRGLGLRLAELRPAAGQARGPALHPTASTRAGGHTRTAASRGHLLVLIEGAGPAAGWEGDPRLPALQAVLGGGVSRCAPCAGGVLMLVEGGWAPFDWSEVAEPWDRLEWRRRLESATHELAGHVERALTVLSQPAGGDFDYFDDPTGNPEVTTRCIHAGGA